MRPAAQIQAVIELLDILKENPYPADRTMANYFRARRYIGSKDKAAISEWFYTVLRQRASLTYLVEQCGGEDHPRDLLIVALHQSGQMPAEIFTGEDYAPEALSTAERTMLEALQAADLNGLLAIAPVAVQGNMPEWLTPLLQNSLGERFMDEMQAMQQRASTDIRVNLLKASREKVLESLKDEGYTVSETSVSPWGLRFDGRVGLFNLKSFKQGWYEVQDEGSQLLALVTNVQSGQKVVDFCAGAGGKTLALAAMMNNKGVIHACDVHSRRLEELGKRAKRAGVHNIQTHLLSTERDKWVKRNVGKMDVVLLDAPCSGSGTWRRNPDARWNLTEEALQQLQQTQQSILDSACRLVKPGGKLVYASCSLLKEENEQQVEQFLMNHPEFAAAELPDIGNAGQLIESDHYQMRTYPGMSGMDGFFVAVLTHTRQHNA